MRRTSRWTAAAAALAVTTLGLVTACGSDAPTAPSPSGSLSASADASPEPLTIPITIAGGQVQPNGEKLTAELGQQIVLIVTSDEADEVHAHIGGDGYELEVPANQPTTGSFTPSQPGSFEIESHHLGKVIVILNVS